MRRFWTASSWLAGVACGVLLVLAALAAPGTAYANEPDCSCCGPAPSPSDRQAAKDHFVCVENCQQKGTCALIYCPLCTICGNCVCAAPGYLCVSVAGTCVCRFGG